MEKGEENGKKTRVYSGIAPPSVVKGRELGPEMINNGHAGRPKISNGEPSQNKELCSPNLEKLKSNTSIISVHPSFNRYRHLEI